MTEEHAGDPIFSHVLTAKPSTLSQGSWIVDIHKQDNCANLITRRGRRSRAVSGRDIAFPFISFAVAIYVSQSHRYRVPALRIVGQVFTALVFDL